MGMCFGVRDALEIARNIPNAADVTVYGELVHNPEVERQLSTAGFRQISEHHRDQSVSTPVVMITAHGVSEKKRSQLKSLGKQLVDTTCPLVKKAHDAAAELLREGRHVLLIGKPGHVEVQGIVEDLESFTIIESAEQVDTYAYSSLGVVCQTTMPPDLVNEVVDRVRACNPHANIRFMDTICRPTRLRQLAMQSLLEQVSAVVVVGGKNSNNTHRLVQLCKQRGVQSFHVQNADELRSEWFEGIEVVGLTAGTSTLDSTINAVQTKLESF